MFLQALSNFSWQLTLLDCVLALHHCSHSCYYLSLSVNHWWKLPTWVRAHAHLRQRFRDDIIAWLWLKLDGGRKYVYPVCGSSRGIAPCKGWLRFYISRRFSLLQHPLLINSSASPSWSLQQSWCLCSSLYAYFVSLQRVTTTNNHSGCSLIQTEMALLWFFGFSGIRLEGPPTTKRPRSHSGRECFVGGGET